MLYWYHQNKPQHKDDFIAAYSGYEYENYGRFQVLFCRDNQTNYFV